MRSRIRDQYRGAFPVVPPRPERISPRNWGIFVDHVYGDETMATIAARQGVCVPRTRQIILHAARVSAGVLHLLAARVSWEARRIGPSRA